MFAMKKLWIAFPMVAVLILGACTEDAPEKVKEAPATVEAPLPLIDRDADVKDYFETMNELVDEYVTLGETILNSLENLDSGKMGYLEMAAAGQDLLESWNKIDVITESIEAHEDLKTTIESKLNPKDVLEFTEMYEQTVARVTALSERIAASDLNKYLPK